MLTKEDEVLTPVKLVVEDIMSIGMHHEIQFQHIKRLSECGNKWVGLLDNKWSLNLTINKIIYLFDCVV